MLYKRFIRQRINEHKKKDGAFRHTVLAVELGIEPSYLSRFLSDDRVHFSDELILRMMRILGIPDDHVDYLWLLREYDRCTDPIRKSYLGDQIRLYRVSRWTGELKTMRDELEKMLLLIAKVEQAETKIVFNVEGTT